MSQPAGWAALFWNAFRRSRNAMVLLDEQRRHVEVNPAYLQLLGRRRDEIMGQPIYGLVAGGPRLSEGEWRRVIAQDEFAGVAELVRAEGDRVSVQFAGHPELITGRRLILFVALSATRVGRRPPHDRAAAAATATLSAREREVVSLIAMGYEGPEIAHELHIAHNTVRKHVANAMDKAGARSRAQLVAKSLADGLAFARD